MPSSRTPEQPTGWRPIEVSTSRNGYDPTPIEVPVTKAPDGGTAPAPARTTSTAAKPATDKEN